MRKLWNDPIERRAALLSITLHLLALLIFILLSFRPTPEPPLPVIVLDLGPPALAAEEVVAATGEEDAPAAPMTEVEADEIGTATAQVAEQEDATTDDPTTTSASPPDVAEPSPPEIPASAPTPSFAPPATVTAPVAEPEPLPPTEVATELPDITPPDLTAMPELATVTIAEPEIASAPVSERALTDPNVSAAAPEARTLAEPSAEATATEGRVLDSPGAAVTDLGSRELPSEHVSADAITERPLSSSGISAEADTAVPLVATATESSTLTTRAVPQPSVVATVRSDEPAAGAPAENVEGTPGSSTVESNVVAETPPGGTASEAGQVGPQTDGDGRGAATSPDGEIDGTGGSERTINSSLYSQTRQMPYAVLLDNFSGYPQAGLREATTIIEAPVEGYITRLMAFYDAANPVVVGPVRSARDYFLDLAGVSDAVLVHDGGSPDALTRIEANALTTFNAFKEGSLFYRDSARNAPYNLYTRGDDVRNLVTNRLKPNARVISTAAFRPEGFPLVNEVSIPFSGQYRTGFRYESSIGRYRWIRNGEAASHPDGQPILVDTVLVVEAPARPIPGDSAGRLFVSLAGGSAVLYMDGQAITGTWDVAADGTTPPIVFRAPTGEVFNLAPFKSWIVLAPSDAFERFVEVTDE